MDIWCWVGGEVCSAVLEGQGIRVSGFYDQNSNNIKNKNGKPVLFIDAAIPGRDFVVIALLRCDTIIYSNLASRGFDSSDFVDVICPVYLEDTVYRGVPIGKCSYGYIELIGGLECLVKSIGRFCSIHASARIMNNHRIDGVSTFPFLGRDEYKGAFYPTLKWFEDNYTKSIIIGNDVWVGSNVTIMANVTIGDGAVIGAGAVVTKDVEPYAIVGGVPAREIRKRFSDDNIRKLLQISWWDWPDKRIWDNMDLFSNTEEFINRFYNDI